MARVLVAGFGNVLRGDDGFGVEVVRRLTAVRLPEGTALLEVGTGGIALAQELLTTYDRVVIVDAVQRGGRPGQLYVLHVDSVESLQSIDMHMAVPSRALGLAQTLGVLPREVYMIGCEPAIVDDLEMHLSDLVQAAVAPAMEQVLRLAHHGSDAERAS
jgi:hydrogenase maturation protease